MSKPNQDIKKMLQGVSFPPQTRLDDECQTPFVGRGGLLTKKCVRCGGTVQLAGKGLIREACSKCGETHIEPMYR